MATFNVSNSNGRFTLTLTVTQTSQSVANNTSTLSWSLDLKANTAYNFEQFSIGYSVSLNGSTVGSQTRAQSSKYSIADYGSLKIASGSGVTVAHNDDGTKSIPVAFSIDMATYDYSPGPLSGSGTMALTTIARYSTLSVPTGSSLGVQQTITVNRASSNTHTVTWVCGSESGTLCTNSTSTTLYFTPSVTLAAQNTSGSQVAITYTIATTGVGSKNTVVLYNIPGSSTSPSLSLSVSDATSYYNTFGGYVQGYSKLYITATPTLSYSSPIVSYSITADGKTYTTNPVTTSVITGSGSVAIRATATDQRGNVSAPATTSVSVLPYSSPVIATTLYRCDASGVTNDEGAYIRITFNATISSLNGKNSATYRVEYSGATYGSFQGSGTSFDSGPIACGGGVPCDVSISVTDKVSTGYVGAPVPIAFTLMEFYNTGKGVAFGKPATRDGLDVAMNAYFSGTTLFEGNVQFTGGVSGIQIPTATTNAIGGVKVDGSSISIDGNGVISAKQSTLPTASTSTLGGVKVDGVTTTVTNGVLKAANCYVSKIGTWASGTTVTSCSVSTAFYEIILLGITPSASGAAICVAIPGAVAAAGFDFQVADETNYCKWSASSSGFSRVSGAGNLRYVYGVKLQ